jgi:hypothetical protein
MLEICSCEAPSFANLGRPNCVIEMKAIAFPIIVPRFKQNGDRNTIDLTSLTLGADILALTQASTDLVERLYPFPRCENISFDRTETVYETAPSTRKYKIDGVGGVRTFKFELWAKDAVHQILRELEKIGCTEVDFYLPDVAGTLWGIMDDQNVPVLRGYEMATETFDAFKTYATDTTVSKIMVMWDLDNSEAESHSYGITASELGYKANTLKGLVTGNQVAVATTTTTATATVTDGFGSAVNAGKITGLVSANFNLYNDTVNPLVLVPVASVEVSAGVYTLTYAAQTTGDVMRVSVINATGYDVVDTTFVAL